MPPKDDKAPRSGLKRDQYTLENVAFRIAVEGGILEKSEVSGDVIVSKKRWGSEWNKRVMQGVWENEVWAISNHFVGKEGEILDNSLKHDVPMKSKSGRPTGEMLKVTWEGVKRSATGTAVKFHFGAVKTGVATKTTRPKKPKGDTEASDDSESHISETSDLMPNSRPATPRRRDRLGGDDQSGDMYELTRRRMEEEKTVETAPTGYDDPHAGSRASSALIEAQRRAAHPPANSIRSLFSTPGHTTTTKPQPEDPKEYPETSINYQGLRLARYAGIRKNSEVSGKFMITKGEGDSKWNGKPMLEKWHAAFGAIQRETEWDIKGALPRVYYATLLPRNGRGKGEKVKMTWTGVTRNKAADACSGHFHAIKIALEGTDQDIEQQGLGSENPMFLSEDEDSEEDDGGGVMGGSGLKRKADGTPSLGSPRFVSEPEEGQETHFSSAPSRVARKRQRGPFQALGSLSPTPPSTRGAEGEPATLKAAKTPLSVRKRATGRVLNPGGGATPIFTPVTDLSPAGGHRPQRQDGGYSGVKGSLSSGGYYSPSFSTWGREAYQPPSQMLSFSPAHPTSPSRNTSSTSMAPTQPDDTDDPAAYDGQGREQWENNLNRRRFSWEPRILEVTQAMQNTSVNAPVTLAGMTSRSGGDDYRGGRGQDTTTRGAGEQSRYRGRGGY